MSSTVIITAIICVTVIIVSIIGKIPSKKSATYIFDERGICEEVKDEYK